MERIRNSKETICLMCAEIDPITGNKDRLDGICRINQLYGYCERNEKGVFTPKPITINLLMGKLKGDGKFGLLQQNGEKIKGSEFLR